MDEDWFKPTVARHRMEDEHGRGLPAEIQSNRRTSNPTAIPSTSPIPSRQQAATPQSFGSAGAAFSSGRPTGSRVASGVGTSVGKGSAGSRWGALGEGLPFAAPRMSGSGSEAPRVSSWRKKTPNAIVADSCRVHLHQAESPHLASVVQLSQLGGYLAIRYTLQCHPHLPPPFSDQHPRAYTLLHSCLDPAPR
jgi:hypothetical protein